MIFKRIKILRRYYDFTQTQVADYIGKTKCVYANYENGRTIVPLENLIKLSDYYHTSVDYLIGFTDDPIPHQRKQLIIQTRGDSMPVIQIFGKSKCFDTKKAERFFKERGVKVQSIDLPRYGISKGELTGVVAAVGGMDKLINAKHPGAAQLKWMAYDEHKLAALLDEPGLLVTPIVRNGKAATIGYAPEVWARWLTP